MATSALTTTDRERRILRAVAAAKVPDVQELVQLLKQDDAVSALAKAQVNRLVTREYPRFLGLKVIVEDFTYPNLLTASPMIALVWRIHSSLEQDSYDELCRSLQRSLPDEAPRTIHFSNNQELVQDQRMVRKMLGKSQSHTRRLYRMLYGEATSPLFWSPDCPDDIGGGDPRAAAASGGGGGDTSDDGDDDGDAAAAARQTRRPRASVSRAARRGSAATTPQTPTGLKPILIIPEDGEPFQVLVTAMTDIQNLKVKIEGIKDIPVAHQLLWMNDRLLDEDATTLRDYGVKADCDAVTLVVVKTEPPPPTTNDDAAVKAEAGAESVGEVRVLEIVSENGSALKLNFTAKSTVEDAKIAAVAKLMIDVKWTDLELVRFDNWRDDHVDEQELDDDHVFGQYVRRGDDGQANFSSNLLLRRPVMSCGGITGRVRVFLDGSAPHDPALRLSEVAALDVTDGDNDDTMLAQLEAKTGIDFSREGKYELDLARPRTDRTAVVRLAGAFEKKVVVREAASEAAAVFRDVVVVPPPHATLTVADVKDRVPGRKGEIQLYHRGKLLDDDLSLKAPWFYNHIQEIDGHIFYYFTNRTKRRHASPSASELSSASSSGGGGGGETAAKRAKTTPTSRSAAAAARAHGDDVGLEEDHSTVLIGETITRTGSLLKIDFRDGATVQEVKSLAFAELRRKINVLSMRRPMPSVNDVKLEAVSVNTGNNSDVSRDLTVSQDLNDHQSFRPNGNEGILLRERDVDVYDCEFDVYLEETDQDHYLTSVALGDEDNADTILLQLEMLTKIDFWSSKFTKKVDKYSIDPAWFTGGLRSRPDIVVKLSIDCKIEVHEHNTVSTPLKLAQPFSGLSLHSLRAAIEASEFGKSLAHDFQLAHRGKTLVDSHDTLKSAWFFNHLDEPGGNVFVVKRRGGPGGGKGNSTYGQNISI